MKSRIFIIFLTILPLFSADIDALIKAKELYKMQNKKVSNKKSQAQDIIIFFKKEPNKNTLKRIEELKNLQFKRCILPKLCIFKITSETDKTISHLKTDFNTIEKIEIVKKHKFKRY